MSECNRKQFQFRQPVSVQVKGQWYPGAYLHYNESAGEHVAMWSEDGQTNGKINWFPCDQIEPDPYHCLALVPTATPRTGWRLPEPGDKARVTRERCLWYTQEGIVSEFDAERCKVEVEFPDGDTVTFTLDELAAVRLHDAPQPEPTPVPPASKPRSNKQDIIDNATLELAAVALEEHGQDRIAAMVRDLQRDWSEAS